MWTELILLAVLVVAYYVIKDRKPAGMPPGPFEIPFLGSMPIFDTEGAMKIRQKYGDIASIRTGFMRSVVIFDYALGKEIMARPEMAGRPEFFATFSLDDQKTGGLVGSNGQQWQHDRRFVLRNLRNLGMGKSYLEDAINFEAEALVDDLKKYNEEPINFPDSFRTAVLNIIWQMVASTRFDLHSQEVDKIYALTKAARSQSLLSVIPFFFPALGKILPTFITNKIFGENLFLKMIEETKIILKTTLKNHSERSDLDNPKDLIDEYLKEMKDREEEGNNDFCREGALNQIINDLFGAGSDTVNNMLLWVCYLLARYPDIADRMHQEIDKAVPRNRLVSLDDKPNLSYVEAFINEALRFSSMVLMNVQRAALRDTKIGDYFIPKGTMVIVCNYACHNDEKYWDKPQEFNPERFLTKEGKFQAPKQGFFAFGSGRRQCLGETLARMELFLFTTAIAQNFDIEAPEEVDLPFGAKDALGLRIPPSTLFKYKTRA